MDDTTTNSSQPRMTIGNGALLYAAALLAFILGIALASKIGDAAITILAIAYLSLGIALNRVVLRQLIEWHPVYNTLQNVASAKIGMVLLWPVRYPALFIKLLVSRHL